MKTLIAAKIVVICLLSVMSFAQQMDRNASRPAKEVDINVSTPQQNRDAISARGTRDAADLGLIPREKKRKKISLGDAARQARREHEHSKPAIRREENQ
jgi:hypothetical protein